MIIHTSLSNTIRSKVTSRIPLTKFGKLFISLVFLLVVFGGSVATVKADTITFTAEELLGKPTDTSITINIVPASTIEYYYKYGISQGGPYAHQTTPITADGGQPSEVTITGLSPDTRYYYRMIYDGDGDVDDGDYVVRDEHSFHTQRAKGETFIFTVTSDSHAKYNTYYQQTMANIEADNPDFHLDLGDTFMVDNDVNQSQVNNEYLAQRGSLYMGRIGPSVPIFLTSGNHEEEEGWNLDDTPFSIGVASIQARKAYFPTPANDEFYSGNTDPLAAIDETTYGDELREDYYAWTWGDALFVVMDEFQYTMDLSYTPIAGEGSDDPFTGDQWSWTLGKEQYNWLKHTLENNDAKYKFVFSHNMLGGIPREVAGVEPGYVRGGAEAAGYFEWGGRNADGTWGFDTHRPGWEMPIHQLFVENGVSAYFHGHDHLFVYETRDGIVYLEMPSPSWTSKSVFGVSYKEGTYSDYSTIKKLPNTGHLRVTVTPIEAKVEYIRSCLPGDVWNGEVAYSFNITNH